MNENLITEIKFSIGYTEETQQCAKCKYYEEQENAYVDRMWDSYCTYSNLTRFKVSPNAHCAMFQTKE